VKSWCLKTAYEKYKNYEFVTFSSLALEGNVGKWQSGLMMVKIIFMDVGLLLLHLYREGALVDLKGYV